jgi:hypothetical protein
VLSVEDWAEIRRLYRSEGMPIKVIARHHGVSLVKEALVCVISWGRSSPTQTPADIAERLVLQPADTGTLSNLPAGYSRVSLVSNESGRVIPFRRDL